MAVDKGRERLQSRETLDAKSIEQGLTVCTAAEESLLAALE